MKRPIYFLTLACAILGLAGFGVSFPRSQTPRSDFATAQPASAIHEKNEKNEKKKKTGGIPEAWRGSWEVTVAYRDHQTGTLLATDISTASICPGEPILPDSLIRRAECAKLINDHEISTMCGAIHMPMPGCVVFINTALDSRRDGETWTGTGSWRARVVGFCARPEPKHSWPKFDRNTFGEDFVVSGTRVSNQATCNNARPSLLESFFAHSELTPILGGQE
jgi:hypothetical protein